jgi:general secretion pathway protein K
MNAAATSTRQTSQDGFIIVAVLWILGALAALVSIYAVYVMNTASAFRVDEDHLQNEALVSAAIELTAYQLSATPAQRPTHGDFNFHMAKADIAVSFHSEMARIDLNAAPKELLAGLFTSLDVNPDAAANYADQIISWRALPSQNQAAAGAVGISNTVNTSLAGRFFHVNELSAVPGLAPELIERALPFVTVYSGHPQVNIFEATPKVLAALPGMTSELLKTVLAQRQAAGDGQALLQLLGPVANYATTDGGNASRIAVRITYGNGRRANSEIVILTFDAGNEPYSVLSWRDDLETSGDDRPGGTLL